MKKRIALLLAALQLLTLIGCGKKKSMGLELPAHWDGGDSMWNEAHLTLHEDGTFQFSFSPLSSYHAAGNYTAEGDRVICKPHDSFGNTYEFKIVDGNLAFDAAASSPLPDYTPESSKNR